MYKVRRNIIVIVLFVVSFLITMICFNTEYRKICEMILYYLGISFIFVQLLKSHKFDFTDPCVLFSGAYIIFICIGPAYLIPQSYNYHFDILLISFLCYFLFYIGTLFCFKNIKRKHEKREYLKNEHIKSKLMKIKKIKFNRTNILCFFITMSCLIWIVFFIKNIRFLLQNFETNRIAIQSGNGIIMYSIKSLVITIPMLYEELKNKNKVDKKFWLVCLFSFLALFTLGSRSSIILIAAQVLICKIEIDNLNSSRLVRYCLLCLLAVAFLGLLRSKIISGNSGRTFLSSIKLIFLNGNYNLSYIFKAFPRRVPFQLGYTYLINLIMLLPGPQLDFTLWLKKILGLSFSGGGVTPTIIGEFYINFGYAGIFVGMFLMGILGTALSSKRKQISHKSFYIYITLIYALSCMGGIANYIVPILVYGFIYVLINILSEK